MNVPILTRAGPGSLLVVLKRAGRGAGAGLSQGSTGCVRGRSSPAVIGISKRRSSSSSSTCTWSIGKRGLSQSCSEQSALEAEADEDEQVAQEIGIGTAPAAHPRLGFIGAGMMSSAMINGIVAAKVTLPGHIIASDVYRPSLDRLEASGIRTSQANVEVATGSDVVVLAVKPDVIPSVLMEIGHHLKEGSLVVSIAAGVPLSVLEELAPAVTGLSGSGPAYVFVLIEALADGGVRMGLPRATALKLAAQTVKGSATMVLETGNHPGVLKDQVCSPGGTTIAAVEALEQNGFRAAAMAAVVAATSKSIEMRDGKK